MVAYTHTLSIMEVDTGGTPPQSSPDRQPTLHKALSDTHEGWNLNPQKNIWVGMVVCLTQGSEGRDRRFIDQLNSLK